MRPRSAAPKLNCALLLLEAVKAALVKVCLNGGQTLAALAETKDRTRLQKPFSFMNCWDQKSSMSTQCCLVAV